MHIGWTLMNVKQHWPYRGWRLKVYRLGALLNKKGI